MTDQADAGAAGLSRRALIAAAAAAPFLAGGALAGAPAATLGQAFPPAGPMARPGVYWQWMNGNVTAAGLTADLAAMARMGVSSAWLFNNGVGIPRGPVDYGAEDWIALVEHALTEAGRLGLTLSLHNAPGYSGSGGPWITPEHSMQQLVWSQVLLSAGQSGPRLPRPPSKHGFYRDAAVVAFPASPDEFDFRQLLVEASLDGAPVPAAALIETDFDQPASVRMAPPQGGESRLVLRFSEPVAACAVTVRRRPEAPLDPFDGPRDYPPTFTLEASDDGVAYMPVCRFEAPPLRAFNAPAVGTFAPRRARFFRLSSALPTWLSHVELHGAPRLAGWPAKTNAAAGGLEGDERQFAAGEAVAPATVIDLTDRLGEDGVLDWRAPSGRWVVLRLGSTTTGEEVAAAPDAGRGLTCDVLRPEGVDQHMKLFLGPLLDRLAPFAGKALRGITSDSWEAGRQNWCFDLPERFERLRGYGLLRYLPALTGRIVGDAAQTEKLLFDLRRTFAELIAENYYGRLAFHAHQRGLKFDAEPYGDGGFDSLEAAKQVDQALGEFWVRNVYGSDRYRRFAASAASTQGKAVVAVEAFTGMPRVSRWTEYPHALKIVGDRMFSQGVNRLVLHVFVHQPHPTARPGMTMGPFGTHFDRNSTWAGEARGWTDYVARTSQMLQLGRPVADIAWFKGANPSSAAPDFRTSDPVAPDGYDADVLTESDLLALELEGGQLVLPQGGRYACLALAPMESAPLAVLEKLLALQAKGALIVAGAVPRRAAGLSDGPQGDLRAAALADKLSAGGVGQAASLAQALAGRGQGPDLTWTAASADARLAWRHRRLQDGVSVYFVSNQRRRPEQVALDLRAGGRPELWWPETGQVAPAPIWRQEAGRTRVALDLPPSGSVFVVVRPGEGQGFEALITNGRRHLSTEPFRHPRVDPIDGDFALGVWIKPDTVALPGKSFVIEPAAAGRRHGQGWRSLGLSAGTDGARVWLRDQGAPRELLVASQALSGWTHLALARQGRRVSLFIDGALAGQAQVDGKLTSGLGLPADPWFSATGFEGDLGAVEPFETSDLARIVRQGPPPPPEPPAIEWRAGGRDGQAFVRTPGDHRLVGGGRERRLPSPRRGARLLEGPWSLDLGRGATRSLARLSSLRLHPDAQVRHFAGEALYAKTFTLTLEEARGRLELDLGRVEVLARVRLNGADLGQVWKPPFLIDLSPAARTGSNRLEVAVTTLWPNALIGDEGLPVENAYDPAGPIIALPEWYRRGAVKPGDRATFSTWRHYRPDEPLIESGLMGPVRLRFPSL